ncbi:MAG: uridine kinase [Shewanella sp.]|nr:uridine kinase [Shewanella sp.]
MNSQQCVVIAITGASASGKSLIARTIFEELRRDLGTEQIAVINEDAYYHDQSHMTMEERVKTNYDHPKSMDHELLRQDLLKLKSGKDIQIPKYSYTEHTRLAETTSITPKKVIILEGILLLTNPKLRELFDASVFMDTPLDICFLRRLQRDVEERDRTMESVISQYKQTVRPMFLQFIEPSKQHADIIVPRGGKNRIATDILKTRIQHLLAK